MNAFILIIISLHMINDFVFQTNNFVEKKKKLKINYHLVHSAFCSVPIILIYFIFKLTLLKVMGFVICIFLAHFIVDYGKAYFDNKKVKLSIKVKKILEHPIFNFLIFILDQVLHIILIINLSYLFFKDYLKSDDLEQIKYLTYFLTFIFITFFTSVTIKYIYDIIYYPNNEYGEDIEKINQSHHCINEEEKIIYKKFNSLKIGKSIGILERILVFILVLMIGLKECGILIAGLLTLKSITRFKFMDIKIFAEYYLIGTSLSYLMVLFPFFISTMVKSEVQFIIGLIKKLTFM